MWSKQEIEQYKKIILTSTGQSLSDSEAQSSATRMYELIKIMIKDEYEDYPGNTSSF